MISHLMQQGLQAKYCQPYSNGSLFSIIVGEKKLVEISRYTLRSIFFDDITRSLFFKRAVSD